VRTERFEELERMRRIEELELHDPNGYELELVDPSSQIPAPSSQQKIVLDSL